MVGGKIEPGETPGRPACGNRGGNGVDRRPAAVPYLNRFYEWHRDRVNEIPVFLAITSGEESG